MHMTESVSENEKIILAFSMHMDHQMIAIKPEQELIKKNKKSLGRFRYHSWPQRENLIKGKDGEILGLPRTEEATKPERDPPSLLWL